MRITAVLSVPVLVLGFPFPVPDFNNIHLVLTQIQTVICVSMSLKMCVNILFHYLCGCKMNCFRTVGLINTSIVYAVTFCCCLGKVSVSCSGQLSNLQQCWSSPRTIPGHSTAVCAQGESNLNLPRWDGNLN